MSEQITVHCPKCGSENIGEWNVAYALMQVFEWELDEGGSLTPSDVDSSADADWEVDDRRDQYECRRCAWRGPLDALVVAHHTTKTESGE